MFSNIINSLLLVALLCYSFTLTLAQINLLETSADYKLSVTKPGKKFIESLDNERFHQVAIVGDMRLGKSTLLSVLADGKPGRFPHDESETIAKTKGLPLANKLFQTKSQENVLYADSEGFGSTFHVKDGLNVIPVLAMSQVIIYVLGAYSHAGTNMALKTIAKSTEKIRLNDEQKMAHLHLVVRKNTLEIFNETECLEEALAYVKKTALTETKAFVNKNINLFRSISLWGIPTEERGGNLSPEYLSTVNTLRDTIYSQVDDLKYNEHNFEAKSYLQTLQEIVKKINDEKLNYNAFTVREEYANDQLESKIQLWKIEFMSKKIEFSEIANLQNLTDEIDCLVNKANTDIDMFISRHHWVSNQVHLTKKKQDFNSFVSKLRDMVIQSFNSRIELHKATEKYKKTMESLSKISKGNNELMKGFQEEKEAMEKLLEESKKRLKEDTEKYNKLIFGRISKTNRGTEERKINYSVS